ncbi:hypothetical protein [Staphylococcus aureus]|nr:hypothetical protein [Staphylococcus aureus]NDQ23286.1 hypothetical protein [Staphylococcus aureus]
MSIQHLDGYISIEDFFKHMEELSKKEELEKEINQSKSKYQWHPFYTDKEKVVLFLYTFLTIY